MLLEHPLDETLVMCEDQYLAKQVLLEDRKIVYSPSATVLHSHNAALPDVFKRYFDYGAALYRISDKGIGYPLSYMFCYARRALRAAWREGGVSAIIYVMLFELSRITGLWIGRRERHLPTRLKAKLSSHKAFWEGTR